MKQVTKYMEKVKRRESGHLTRSMKQSTRHKIKEGNSSLGEEKRRKTLWGIRSCGQGTQKHLRVVEEETELSSAKARHEEVGEVPRDKAVSKTDEPGFRASDENVGGSDSVTAERTGGVVTGARTEMVQIVSMKGVFSNELETYGLKVPGASCKAAMCKFRMVVGGWVGKDWVRQVRL